MTSRFPERFLSDILTWHLSVIWIIQKEGPFTNCLFFSGKKGREDLVSQMRFKYDTSVPRHFIVCLLCAGSVRVTVP